MKTKRLLKSALVLLTVVLLCIQLCGCSALFELLAGMTFHTSVKFDDLSYVKYDMTYFDAVCSDIEDMLESETAAAQVLSRFEQLYKEYNDICTRSALASIYNYLDVTDTVAEQNYLESYDISIDAQDKYFTIGNKIVTSYCAEDAKTYLGEESFDSFLEYEALTDTLSALLNEEQEIISEYNAACAADYTTEYKGQTVSFANIYTLDLSYDEGNEALALLYEVKNAAVAPIYLRLIKTRSEILKNTEYESFADYSYFNSFAREYTNNEIEKIYGDVKEYFGPLYTDLFNSYTDQEYSDFYYETSEWTTQTLFNKVGTKLSILDTGMANALRFMKEYGYYDIEYSEKKLDASFTSLLYSYNAPFMFVQPSGSSFDIFTFVHEFGHYNAMYNNPYSVTDMETSEVQSTGLELMFMKNYKDIFSESGSAAVEKIILEDCVDTVIMGCLINEFESTVYEENISTVEELNELMMTLYREYGYIDESDTRTALYSWVDIAHLFIYPFYYISYSVSTFSSLSLWLQSTEDYDAAFAKYIQISDATGEKSFASLMEELEVPSVFVDGAVKEIAEKLDNYIFKKE